MAIPKVKNITDLKKDAKSIIEAANSGQSIIVTHKSGDIFLVPSSEYERLKEYEETGLAFEEAENDLVNGNEGIDHDELFAMLYKKYGFIDENKVVKKSKRRS